MIFSEIVLEGVKCFRGLCRYTLKPAYNLVYGANESGKTVVADCLAILLNPTRQLPENHGYTTWGPPGNSRAGLVFSEGGQNFRLTRDFVNGMVSLWRQNPQTQKYEMVAQNHAQVEAYLRNTIRFPGVSAWKKLFVFDKTDMPSGKPKVIVQQVAAPASQMGAPAPGGAPGFMPPMPGVPMPSAAAPTAPAGYGMSPVEIKQQMDVLKQQMDQVQKVEKTQYEIDGLEAKLFDIENKTKEIRSMEDKVEQMARALKEKESFQELPPDIVHRIENFEEVQRDHASKMYDIEGRLSKIKTDFTAVKNRVPFFKSPPFIGGVAGVVVGIIILAAFVEQIPALKSLAALTCIGGIGAASWVLWNEISFRGKEGDLQKKLTTIEDEQKEELKKFDVEGSVIRRLMQEAKVEEAKDLQKELKDYKHLTDTRDSLLEKIKKAKEEANYDSLTREQKEIKAKVETLTADLRTTGAGAGFTQDSADIQRQIEALQWALDHPGAAPPAPPPNPAAPPAFAPEGGFAPPPTSPPAASGDGYLAGAGDGGGYLGGGDADYMMGGAPAPAGGSPDAERTMVSGAAAQSQSVGGGGIQTMVDELWTAAEQLTGLNRSTVILQVKDRFNVYVQAFTAKKYNEGDLSSEKFMSLRNVSGSYTSLEDLSPSTQDAAWLALKIALLENISKTFKLPVVLDDPLRNLDDSRLAMVSKALKRIGTINQVVLLSTQRAHSKLADNTIELNTGG